MLYFSVDFSYLAIMQDVTQLFKVMNKNEHEDVVCLDWTRLHAKDTTNNSNTIWMDMSYKHLFQTLLH